MGIKRKLYEIMEDNKKLDELKDEVDTLSKIIRTVETASANVDGSKLGVEIIVSTEPDDLGRVGHHKVYLPLGPDEAKDIAAMVDRRRRQLVKEATEIESKYND